MNKVILIGRLTKDPDVKTSANGTDIAMYTLAVDRKRQKDREQETDFIRCVAFGKSAEWANAWLKKGMKICVTGRIQTGAYTNSAGDKIYTTDVIVEDQEFVESKKSSQENDGTPPFN